MPANGEGNTTVISVGDVAEIARQALNRSARASFAPPTIENCNLRRRIMRYINERSNMNLVEQAHTRSAVAALLLPDLRAHLDRASTLHHRFVIWPTLHPCSVAFANEQYLGKCRELLAARSAKNWLSYVFIHLRPYRTDALLEVLDELTDREYWELVSMVFTDVSAVWCDFPRWASLWNSNRSEKGAAMDEGETATLARLPDVVTVYRGQRTDQKNRLAWSLVREDAEYWAARARWDKPKDYASTLLTAQVKKSDIHAFQARESTIIANQTKVISKKPFTEEDAMAFAIRREPRNCKS